MSLASAELGLVSLVADVEVIVIRIIATGVLVPTKETHEAVANVAAGQALELLKVRLLSDVCGEQNLALLWLVLVPSALEVLQINHSCNQMVICLT